MRPSAEHTSGPSSSSTTGSSAATPSPPTLPVADASSSSSSSPSPAALETLSSSTSSQGTSDANEQRQDREVLKLWSIYMTPLRTLQPWSDAAWTAAVTEFNLEVSARGLDAEGFLARNNSSWTLTRERYKAGPPAWSLPGYRTPFVGQRFPLSSVLPTLVPIELESRPTVAADGETGAARDVRPLATATAHAMPWTEEARGGPRRVVLVEFWASWCEGCQSAFPMLSLLQKAYAPVLEVIAVGKEDIFSRSRKPASSTSTAGTTAQTSANVRAFLEGQMNEAEGGKLPYGVYEDPESKVTEAIFHKVAVPFVPNAFLFINSRLFWQGEPDLANPAIGFSAAVEEAVGIASGIRDPPGWFVEAVERAREEESESESGSEDYEEDEEDSEEEQEEFRLAARERATDDDGSVEATSRSPSTRPSSIASSAALPSHSGKDQLGIQAILEQTEAFRVQSP